uniref:Uncharacterized protein n=1 Tax=Ditylenchus dipsaci TaxID=166011 RepID=A0A915EHX4_9BILA
MSTGTTAKNKSTPGSPLHHAAPSTGMDTFLEICTQFARKYLFLDVSTRAIVYLVFVLVLSLIAEYIPLPMDYYLTQKHNVFNRFGTKMGWFWTCLLLCPFIWLTSHCHHGSKSRALYDLSRMGVATFLWFIHVEQRTGKCHGALNSERFTCSVDGGKWIPGFDISGHSFLLIYSMLIICEERSRPTPQHIPNRFEYENFKELTKTIRYLFLGLFVLHLVWDFQLIVTALFYHTALHKLLGAIIAVLCWFVTYRVWYPVAFPSCHYQISALLA